MRFRLCRHRRLCRPRIDGGDAVRGEGAGIGRDCAGGGRERAVCGGVGRGGAELRSGHELHGDDERGGAGADHADRRGGGPVTVSATEVSGGASVQITINDSKRGADGDRESGGGLSGRGCERAVECGVDRDAEWIASRRGRGELDDGIRADADPAVGHDRSEWRGECDGAGQCNRQRRNGYGDGLRLDDGVRKLDGLRCRPVFVERDDCERRGTERGTGRAARMALCSRSRTVRAIPYRERR